MGKKRYIPRWIHSEIVVTEEGFTLIDPDVFMNKTSWPFLIEHLTIFGYPLENNGEYLRWAGIGPLVQAEIGMSGATDINLVPAPVSSSFARTRPYVQLGDMVQGTTFTFQHPYLLPRDSGFSCEMRLDWDNTDTPITGSMYHGLALHGYKAQTNRPAMLAALYNYSSMSSGNTVTIDAADMLNDGEEDIVITHMQLTHPSDLSDDQGTDSILSCLYWKINPLSGLSWMPNFVHVSGITPYVQYPNTRRGILPYCMTPNQPTYLFRRQRLGIKLNPMASNIAQPVNITLFGYLEVE